MDSSDTFYIVEIPFHDESDFHVFRKLESAEQWATEVLSQPHIDYVELITLKRQKSIQLPRPDEGPAGRDAWFARYAGRAPSLTYDIFHFDRMPPGEAKLAMDKGWIDPEDAQNDAPTAAELIDFALKWKDLGCTLSGYVVSPNREDTRVTIDSIECDIPEYVSREFVEAWEQLGFRADERSLTRLWWD